VYLAHSGQFHCRRAVIPGDRLTGHIKEGTLDAKGSAAPAAKLESAWDSNSSFGSTAHRPARQRTAADTAGSVSGRPRRLGKGLPCCRFRETVAQEALLESGTLLKANQKKPAAPIGRSAFYTGFKSPTWLSHIAV
jgi:hypothetical protein